MIASGPPRPLAESDPRDQFDCGREALNLWFQRRAWVNHLSDDSRVSVLMDDRASRIIGFVSLSQSSIERSYLPKARQRNRPNSIPVTLLGQLAVDIDYQGQGHAVSLLQFALRTALGVSSQIASAGVITHPIDDSVRAFYNRWGFHGLPFDPGGAMMISMDEIRRSAE